MQSIKQTVLIKIRAGFAFVDVRPPVYHKYENQIFKLHANAISINLYFPILKYEHIKNVYIDYFY